MCYFLIPFYLLYCNYCFENVIKSLTMLRKVKKNLTLNIEIEKNKNHKIYLPFLYLSLLNDVSKLPACLTCPAYQKF